MTMVPTFLVTLAVIVSSLCLISVEAKPRDDGTSDPRALPPSLLEPLPKTRSRDAAAAATDFYKTLMHDDAPPVGFGSRETDSDSANANTNEVCRPSPDPRHAQYLVGYGSLMQKASKDRTAPDTGISVPVLIRGFRREWNTLGVAVGSSTTYLGVVKEDRSSNSKNVSSFNAVVFKLPVTAHNLHETLKSYDEREEFYCRQKVPNANVVALLNNYGSSGIEPNADFWIYINKPEFTAPPSEKYPIVQSYVDVFVSGCLELEKEYNLPNFTDFCISSTNGWSPQWVNDRIYPRRPFLYQPQATAIDKALAKNLPNIFDKIVIEG